MRSKFAINIFLLTFIFSCNEESIRESPTNLIWAPSDFSEYGASFFSFREGDDNNLYSTGFVNNQFGVHREINGNWEIVLQLEWPKFGVQDFAVFKQVIYLVSEGMLWKASGANVEKVNFGNRITSISQLNEKLIVTGDFSDGANTTSGAAFTEDGSLFTPIAPAEGNFITPGYLILATSSKLFIGSGNFNAYEYDGLNLKKIEFSQWFSNVDTEGNFYTIDHNSDGRRQIVKLKNGVSTKLGSPFGKENIISTILLKDDIVIAFGDNSKSHLSVAFFLDKDEWHVISTTNRFFGTFKYDDRIFAYTGEGIITELVYQ